MRGDGLFRWVGYWLTYRLEVPAIAIALLLFAAAWSLLRPRPGESQRIKYLSALISDLQTRSARDQGELGELRKMASAPPADFALTELQDEVLRQMKIAHGIENLKLADIARKVRQNTAVTQHTLNQLLDYGLVRDSHGSSGTSYKLSKTGLAYAVEKLH
jgi:hypothetical protein